MVVPFLSQGCSTLLRNVKNKRCGETILSNFKTMKDKSCLEKEAGVLLSFINMADDSENRDIRPKTLCFGLFLV